MNTKNNFVASYFEELDIIEYLKTFLDLSQFTITNGLCEEIPYLIVTDNNGTSRYYAHDTDCKKICEYKTLKDLEDNTNLPF